MESYGNIYVPNACKEEDANCHVHFAFHGTDGIDIGTKKNKYNHFAATNNVVMVYPRSNAYPAWDIFGIIDPDNFANKEGIYPRLIMAMLERLSQGCPELPPEPKSECLGYDEKEQLRTAITEFGQRLQDFMDDAASQEWTELFFIATGADLLKICNYEGEGAEDLEISCLQGLDLYQGIMLNLLIAG